MGVPVAVCRGRRDDAQRHVPVVTSSGSGRHVTGRRSGTCTGAKAVRPARVRLDGRTRATECSRLNRTLAM